MTPEGRDELLAKADELTELRRDDPDNPIWEVADQTFTNALAAFRHGRGEAAVRILNNGTADLLQRSGEIASLDRMWAAPSHPDES
jgi:hypothetical protein